MIFFKGEINNETDEDKLERLKKERKELEDKDKLRVLIENEEKRISDLKNKKKKDGKTPADLLNRSVNWLGDYAKDISKNFDKGDGK